MLISPRWVHSPGQLWPLITIEGPDGIGKTTQSKALAEKLGATYYSYPDRTTVSGRAIDAWLKGGWSAVPIDGSTELVSLNAIVFQALQTFNRYETLPKLQAMLGRSPVIVDRYWMSGYVYGIADGLDGDMLRQVHDPLPQPSACLLLKAPVDVLKNRILKRGTFDRYEARGSDFLEKLSASYDDLWLHARHRHNWSWQSVESVDGDPSATLLNLERELMNQGFLLPGS